MEYSLKKIVVSYVIAVAAGVLAFFLAMDLRIFVLTMYLMSIAGGIPWASALVNSVAIIILMAFWLAYVFFVQFYFEKKCEATRAGYIRGFLMLLLPVILAYTALEIFMKLT